MKILRTVRGTLGCWKSFFGALLFCAITAMSSHAQTWTTLADFNGTNGSSPLGLIQGFDGNFYGTTLQGGAQNYGTAFKMTPAGILTTLHSFCATGTCLDGYWPEGRLIQASNGDFYGPTDYGGANGAGLIYRITAAGEFSVLYNFLCTGSCTDGITPTSVIQARNGNLYGTTYGWRDDYPNGGTVFELSLAGTLTPLHAFTGPDGANPVGLLQASNGNFYGSASEGGSPTNCPANNLPGCGTVFQITPSGTLMTVHSFKGYDGAFPGIYGALIEGADGNLYGTAGQGGSAEGGTIFKIGPGGKFTTLYNFCSQMNCADGSNPAGSMVQGSDGNIYGITVIGGNSIGAGTIFKITPQGVFTTLYDFCSQQNCADGWNPKAGLIQSTDGNFYGTATGGGGPSGSGTIFRFSVGLGPFVRLLWKFGKVGQTEGILGQGLKGTTGVLVNGTPASFTVVSDTIIRATIPSGATTGYITVQTPGGTLKSNMPFRVVP